MCLEKKIADRAVIKGNFVLRSGNVTDTYFDKYQIEAAPDLLLKVSKRLVSMIPPGTDVLAGMDLGGIPICVTMSQISGLPAAFIRKRRKSYGTCRLVEGAELVNRNVLIIEDVVSTGGQVITSAAMLRQLGIEITKVLCVIDRETGGKENLEAVGIQLLSLFKMSEFDL